MVKRNNHYEAAFEAYLRFYRMPYIAVDETKRSLLAGGDSVKSLDFIVSSNDSLPPPDSWASFLDSCSTHPPSMAEGPSINDLKILPGRIAQQANINHWLVDVKGRRFPSGKKHKQYWKNWSTCDDILGLCRWEDLFGSQFGGLLVFTYNIVGNRAPLPEKELFEFRGSLYGFVAIRLSDYLNHARRISPKWNTVALSTTNFRRLARPAGEFLAATCD